MKILKFRVWDLIGKRMLKWGDIMNLPAWEIFPGTPEQRAYNVMQYTGINDKNKKELYDGDIFAIGSREDNIICQVIFDEENLCYTASYLHGTKITINLGDIHRSCEFEIIGNIYENPELCQN